MADHVYNINNACNPNRAHVLHGRIAGATGPRVVHALACFSGCDHLCTTKCTGSLQGTLHGQARQHLGQLVFYIFVPCLTFTKLASSVDLNNLTIWWPLPVNTALR